MSKKRDKNTKDDKDKKHCKSRKTDDQKWERPDGCHKEYEARRRRGEGRVTKLRIRPSPPYYMRFTRLSHPVRYE